jgi:hypothetical protein
MKRDLVAVRRTERLRRLPDDFVASTMVAISEARHRRTMRRRGLSITSLALIAAVLIGLRSYRESVAIMNSTPDALGERIVDRAIAYELTRSADAPDVGDYLLPNAENLANLSYNYSDFQWQYDPDWRWVR